LIKEDKIWLGRPEFFPYQAKTKNNSKLKKLNKNTDVLNHNIIPQKSPDPKTEEEQLVQTRETIECAIEKYCCCFCKYKGDHPEMENHYYDCHEKAIENIPGAYLSRKIELLIINGDKYFVKSLLKY
jgi:hypothetical protein